MRTLGKLLLSMAMLVGVASASEAGTLLCPVDNTGTQLQIDWTGAGTATCEDSGNSGFPNASDDPLLGLPYIGECPTGCTVTGSTSGSFTILGDPGEYLILFKFGQGQNDPSYFLIGLSGILTGTWELLPGDGQTVLNALSHVALWGEEGDTPDTPEIPEPASLLLIGAGLFGAAAAKRRRTTKTKI